MLNRENPVQILAPAAYKCAALASCLYRKAPVVFGQILLPQEAIGFLHRDDLAQSQLLRQPPLPGAVAALHPPSRLRRIRWNHLGPHFFQGSSQLRHLVLIHLAARLRCHEEMARPITIQGTEDTPLFDHLPHRRHQRPRSFFLHQLRVIDLASGIVQDGDQIVVPTVPKPGMFAGVDMQQHPRQWTPRAPPPMRPPPPLFLYQARSLQRRLHPRVAELHAVFLSQLLVEMPHIEIEVLLSIPVSYTHLTLPTSDLV